MNRFLRPSERQLRHEFESVKGESCISNESSREWIGHGIDADDLEQVKVADRSQLGLSVLLDDVQGSPTGRSLSFRIQVIDAEVSGLIRELESTNEGRIACEAEYNSLKSWFDNELSNLDEPRSNQALEGLVASREQLANDKRDELESLLSMQTSIECLTSMYSQGMERMKTYREVLQSRLVNRLHHPCGEIVLASADRAWLVPVTPSDFLKLRNENHREPNRRSISNYPKSRQKSRGRMLSRGRSVSSNTRSFFKLNSIHRCYW